MIDDEAAQYGGVRRKTRPFPLSAYRRPAVVRFNAVFGTGTPSEALDNRARGGSRDDNSMGEGRFYRRYRYRCSAGCV